MPFRLHQSTRSIFFTLTLLVGLLVPAIALAQPPEYCQCLWQGSFNKIISRADFIVSGEIITRKGNAMDLKIQHTFLDKGLQGKEYNDTIRVWGYDGKECRPRNEQFNEHNQWLFALNKITEENVAGFNPSTPNIGYGRKGDYYLSQCGAYWLQYHDGFVTGNLIKGQRWQWHDKKMNPVLIDLIDAYINGILPDRALIEAAKPQTAAKQLMEKTQRFLKQQTQ